MKKFPILPIFLLWVAFVSPQINAQDNSWSKRYQSNTWNLEFRSIVRVSNGNIIVAGSAIASIDSLGGINWCKKLSIPSSSGYVRVKAMTRTPDSSIILAGRVYYSGNPDIEVCVFKMDQQGEILWSKAFDLGLDGDIFMVSGTNDNGCILTGFFKNTGSRKTLVIRLDSTGNILWDRYITCSNSNSNGVAIEQTPDGGFILTGNLINNPPIDRVLFLMRLSPTGEVLWAKRQWETMGYTVGLDVKVVADGYLCLYIDQDHYCNLMKTDLSGNVLWIVCYPFPSPENEEDNPTKLIPMSSGGFAFVTPSADMVTEQGALFRIDDNGIPEWSKQVYSSTIQVVQADDGSLVILGSSTGGVDGGKYYAPYGLSRIDSAGVHNSCTEPLSLSILMANHGLQVLDVSDSSGVSIHPFEITSEPDNLTSSNGCVEHYSGEKETNGSESIITVFPNPSSGIVTLGIHPETTEKINKLEVINSAGATVALMKDPGCQIDLRSYPCGLYLLRAETNTGTLTKRIIILR